MSYNEKGLVRIINHSLRLIIPPQLKKIPSAIKLSVVVKHVPNMEHTNSRLLIGVSDN